MSGKRKGTQNATRPSEQDELLVTTFLSRSRHCEEDRSNLVFIVKNQTASSPLSRGP